MGENDSTNLLLRAILAVLIDQREGLAGDLTPRRIEVLLADAGLSPVEIAQLTGKQAAAVRMALSRARAKNAKGKSK